MFNDGFLQISIKLADGQLFPLFRCNGPQNCQLDLIPAQQEQEQIDLHVFSRRLDTVNSEPVSIGSLKLKGLPKSDDMEIQLQAKLDINGMLTLTVLNKISGSKDLLVVNLVSPKGKKGAKKSGKIRKILSIAIGAIIIVTVLALLIWLAFMIANWGQQKPDVLPVSSHIETLKISCFT